MSLAPVYIKHRLHIFERHLSRVSQMLKLNKPSDADDLVDMERIWLAECEELRAAFLRRDSAYFAEREQGMDDWDAQ
jgi:hypothetical protein